MSLVSLKNPAILQQVYRRNFVISQGLEWKGLRRHGVEDGVIMDNAEFIGSKLNIVWEISDLDHMHLFTAVGIPNAYRLVI